MQAEEIIKKEYGGRIRIRVCGVLEKDREFLLANHKGINQYGDFWCAPGGGVEFGETLVEALKREFFEETNLKIEVGEIVGIYEFINKPLHALEVFFNVEIAGGEMKLGYDPETKIQILDKLDWFALEKIKDFPAKCIHQHFLKML